MYEPQDAAPGSRSRPAAGSDAAKAKHGEGFATLIMWSWMAVYGAVLAVAIAVGAHMSSSLAQYSFVALATVTLMLSSLFVVASIAYLTSKSTDAQDRRRPLVTSAVLGVGVAVCITCMVLLANANWRH